MVDAHQNLNGTRDLNTFL